MKVWLVELLTCYIEIQQNASIHASPKSEFHSNRFNFFESICEWIFAFFSCWIIFYLVLNFMWMLNSITTSEYFIINWIPFTIYKSIVHFNLIWDKNNWNRQTFMSKHRFRFHARLSSIFIMYIYTYRYIYIYALCIEEFISVYE